jgi:tRNA-2-methylthio-N6-dimethylallyladenosine synthase
MRRRYTREEYLDGVSRLREAVPGVEVSTDVIVGFPGETSQDFEQTMGLVRDVRFQSIYSFKYSPRPNTLAAKRLPDDVTEAEKTARIVALQALQREIQTERHAAYVGQVHDVLVDSVDRDAALWLGGRTSGNVVVHFGGLSDWLGREVPVRITTSTPHGLRGEVLVATSAEA